MKAITKVVRKQVNKTRIRGRNGLLMGKSGVINLKNDISVYRCGLAKNSARRRRRKRKRKRKRRRRRRRRRTGRYIFFINLCFGRCKVLAQEEEEEEEKKEEEEEEKEEEEEEMKTTKRKMTKIKKSKKKNFC